MSRTMHLCEGEILLNAEGDSARSLTIKNGMVVAINAAPPAEAHIIALSGRFAVPGFVDSHLHLTYGASGLGDIDLRQVTSKKMFQDAIVVGEQHNAGIQWVVASGWSTRILGEQPDRTWLTHVRDIPTICFSEDLHSAVVNDTLLALLDHDFVTSMQGGSRLQEGILAEDALFHGVCPLIPHAGSRVKVERSIHALREMHSKGITLIGTMEEQCEIEEVIQQLQTLRVMRIRAMCTDSPTPEVLQFCNAIHADAFLQITGFKTFVDGTLGSRTAKMYEPWNDVEGDGILASYAAEGSLQAWVTTVASAGYSPIIHAIGDRAVGIALEAIDAVPLDQFPRIEHAQFIAAKDLQLLRQTWFGVQPLHQPSDASIAAKAVGVERAELLHNWRRMLDAGAKLSFGSDWPVAAPDPLCAMGIAIKQGLSPSEAFAASTRDAAVSLRTPEAGALNIGHFGDVVILDRHPLKCDWKKGLPSVTMTILDGTIVYEKEA